MPSANKMSDGENVVMTWTRDLVPAPPDSQVHYLTLQDDRLWVVYNIYPITYALQLYISKCTF